jgi:hypothetical protein
VQEVQEALLSHLHFLHFLHCFGRPSVGVVVSRSHLAFTLRWSPGEAVLLHRRAPPCRHSAFFRSAGSAGSAGSSALTSALSALSALLWTPFCWRGGLAQPPRFHIALVPPVRLCCSIAERHLADILPFAEVQEVQEVQEALLSRPFCTFCIALDALLLAW